MGKVKRGDTMTKTLYFDVEDERTTCEMFVRAWKRAEAGEQIETEHRLCFESLELLLKTMTTARWHLLKTLRSLGPVSIRSLASTLGRNYKNVHEDVTRLFHVGLIEKTAEGRVEVSWDFVEARLHLAA
jgi:predicted transcriptional regulator